jgi:uncharacterized protein YihD (DUF1040 family)
VGRIAAVAIGEKRLKNLHDEVMIYKVLEVEEALPQAVPPAITRS